MHLYIYADDTFEQTKAVSKLGGRIAVRVISKQEDLWLLTWQSERPLAIHKCSPGQHGQLYIISQGIHLLYRGSNPQLWDSSRPLNQKRLARKHLHLVVEDRDTLNIHAQDHRAEMMLEPRYMPRNKTLPLEFGHHVMKVHTEAFNRYCCQSWY